MKGSSGPLTTSYSIPFSSSAFCTRQQGWPSFLTNISEQRWSFTAICKTLTQLTHRRVDDHVPQRLRPGHDHQQAIDAQPAAARRRHPVFERAHELFVVGMR